MSNSIKLGRARLPGRRRVYADPAGHPFCLCVEDPPGQA
jgi:hypothetical protein